MRNFYCTCMLCICVKHDTDTDNKTDTDTDTDTIKVYPGSNSTINQTVHTTHSIHINVTTRYPL